MDYETQSFILSVIMSNVATWLTQKKGKIIPESEMLRGCKRKRFFCMFSPRNTVNDATPGIFFCFLAYLLPSIFSRLISSYHDDDYTSTNKKLKAKQNSFAIYASVSTATKINDKKNKKKLLRLLEIFLFCIFCSRCC